MADSDVHFLKPPQVEAMRDAAHEGRHGHRDDALVTLLYDTGLRRAEAAALTRGMLDLDDGVLRLPGHVQKDYPTDATPDAVTIALDLEDELRTSRTLRSYLATRDDDRDALVRSRKGGALAPKSIGRAVQRTAQRADVEPYTFDGRGSPADVSAHTLRHSVAYRLLDCYDGYSMYHVRRRLRHKRLSTTEQRYAHFDTV